MYTLTLTQEDRKAIDWIGNRYYTGDETYRALMEWIPEDAEWDSNADITFELPEHAAWELRELWEQEDMLFPCFADSLKSKLLAFADSIV